MNLVFDHTDAYNFGHEAASLGKPREVPVDKYNFADELSKEEFTNSWLQGYDEVANPQKAPWES